MIVVTSFLKSLIVYQQLWVRQNCFFENSVTILKKWKNSGEVKENGNPDKGLLWKTGLDEI